MLPPNAGDFAGLSFFHTFSTTLIPFKTVFLGFPEHWLNSFRCSVVTLVGALSALFAAI